MIIDDFKAAFRNHPAGVTLITADAGGRPVAMTVTSVTSVSANPPLLSFSVSDQSSSAPTILAVEHVVVHFLAAEQLHIARLGSTSGIDRFADRSLWERLPTGEPYFPQAENWLRAQVINTMRAGNATIVCAEALESKPQAADIKEDDSTSTPLIYHNRAWYGLRQDVRIG